MDEVLKIALTRELPKKTKVEKKVSLPSDISQEEETGEGPQEPHLTH